MTVVVAVPYFTDHGEPCCRIADPCPAHTATNARLIRVPCPECEGRGFTQSRDPGDRWGLARFCEPCDGHGDITVTP